MRKLGVMLILLRLLELLLQLLGLRRSIHGLLGLRLAVEGQLMIGHQEGVERVEIVGRVVLHSNYRDYGR